MDYENRISIFLLLKFILVLLMKEIERLNENLKLKIG